MQWIAKKEIIAAIFVLTIIAVIAFLSIGQKKDLYKKNGLIANAFVTGFEHDYKGRLQIKYQFLVQNKLVSNTSSFPELKGGAEKFLSNKYFPVIYLKNNFEENELLASVTKFKKLSIAIPDSLRWLDKLEIPW